MRKIKKMREIEETIIIKLEIFILYHHSDINIILAYKLDIKLYNIL